MTKAAPVVCDCSALTSEQMKQHTARTIELLKSVKEVRTIADGYALRVPDLDNVLFKVAEFIEYDRKCCPFLRHGVMVEPDDGAIWLHLGGSPEACEYLQGELASLGVLRAL
jgi:hypothetical protein